MGRSLLGFVAVLVTVILAGLPSSVSGQDWLDNGDFEAGTTDWSRSQGYAPDCEAYAGDSALGIGAEGVAFPSVSRTLTGPFPAATYTLSGWLRVQSGAAQVTLYIGFKPDLQTETKDLPSTSGYAPFSFTTTANSQSQQILITFSLETTESTEVCIDNLSLTTPDPLPTDTPAAASPTPTPTSQPTSTATVATATSMPSSTPPATSTAAATATRAATATSAPSFQFTNGGFEQGLQGWSKYGGDLTTTTSAFAGSAAGLLVSDTESTKWAYQSVAVDPSGYYELSAQVLPGAGVQQALLRISWYASSDASGAAIGTVDSLESASGPGGRFVFLTTGSVAPPAGTQSARARVLLVPNGPGHASLAMDQVSFRAVAPPTPTPTPTFTPSPTPSATTVATATPTVAPLATLPPTAGATEAAAPSPPAVQAAAALPSPDLTRTATPAPASASAVAQVASQRAVVPAATSISDSFASNRPASSGSSIPWTWLLGVVLVIGGFGGAYLQGRRS